MGIHHSLVDTGNVMESKGRSIPRKIWLLWLQGQSNAPFIVRKCVESWENQNPDWEINFLDREKLNDYITVSLPKEKLAGLSLAKQSNLIRLQLLSKYGGVWADATTYCMRPLDDWIDDCTASGFFAFYRPSGDRLLANWFMASEPKCPLVARVEELYLSYFLNNQFPRMDKKRRFLRKVLYVFFNRNIKTTHNWFSPLIIKCFKIYPYFIFHYIFERVVSTDLESQTIWKRTKKIRARGPLTILRHGLFSTLHHDIKREIDEKRAPLYKLTWKYDSGKYSPSTLLYYLLERNAE
jgi:hypothetical protein